MFLYIYFKFAGYFYVIFAAISKHFQFLPNRFFYIFEFYFLKFFFLQFYFIFFWMSMIRIIFFCLPKFIYFSHLSFFVNQSNVNFSLCCNVFFFWIFSQIYLLLFHFFCWISSKSINCDKMWWIFMWNFHFKIIFI